MVQVHHPVGLHGRLLSSAVRILDAEGIEAVTIRACARAEGVSHAAPAKHFADRRTLLTALATQCMAELLNDVAERLAKAPASARARLGQVADATVGYALVHPHRYRLMWRSDLLDTKDPALERLTDQLFGQIEAIAAEVVLPADTTRETLVIAICSAIHGYVSMRIDRNFRPASDEAVPRPRHFALIDLLLGPAA